MHWWQTSFRSSTRSKDTEDDITVSKPGSSRTLSRTRARKLKHVTEKDIDSWRNSMMSPQPILPKPDLQASTLKEKRNSKLHSSPRKISYSMPLPSPNLLHGPLDDDAIDALNGLIRSSSDEEAQTKFDQIMKTPSSKKSQDKRKQRLNSSRMINIPSSSPTSPYSCPSLSPSNLDMLSYSNMIPSLFNVWSEPNIPYYESNVGLNLTSPRLITLPCSQRPMSPSIRRNNSVVHPLPLPPEPISARSQTVKCECSSANVTLRSTSSVPQVLPVKSQWQKGKLIGRGTFGSVYVASNRETGALCAMKEVEILADDSKSEESMRQLEREIEVLSNLKHPNIVHYYGSEIVGDKFYIYLEYVHPGSINKFIRDHCGAMTESIVRNFTRHILCGLAYLHATKTIHRDIKGANLLVDAYGVVKLADFGMAKHLNGQAAHLSLKGSPYWLAPEILQPATEKDASPDIGLAVDIWSLGCTIIEMMNGKPPWSEFEGAAVMFKVLKETPPIPETLSEDGRDFLQCCFVRNPAERPTATKLLDHPFVNSSPTKSTRLEYYESS